MSENYDPFFINPICDAPQEELPARITISTVAPAAKLPQQSPSVILPPTVTHHQEALDLLCSTIAQSTQSLASIVTRLQAQHTDFPSIASIYRLLRDNEAFSDQYACAKSDQADLMADQILEISDDDSGDDQGNTSVQRAKLKVEARKWLASKLKSKVYGDKSDRLAVAIQINGAECPVDLSRY